MYTRLLQSLYLCSYCTDAVVLVSAVGERRMAFVGISLPFDELGRFRDDIGVRRIGQRRDTLSDILIGHFQVVATAARHLPSVFFSSARRKTAIVNFLAGAQNG